MKSWPARQCLSDGLEFPVAPTLSPARKTLKKFTKLSFNFLLSKSPKIWFSGKDPLNTNITNWNKIVYVLHQLHRKYSHIFCHLALTLLCSSCVPVDKHLSIKFDQFLQKSLIDCKLTSNQYLSVNHVW